MEVLLCMSLSGLHTLYAVALGILDTHSFSPQLAIRTLPSSPTTSLHSIPPEFHQKQSNDIRYPRVSSGPPPKENASHDTTRSHANLRGNMQKKDRYLHSLACNCSGAVLAVAATVLGPDVTYKGEVLKKKKVKKE